MPRGPPGNGGGHVQVAQQFFAGAYAFRGFFLDLPPGSQEQFGIIDDACANKGLAAPGRIENADFLCCELMVGNLFGEALAVEWFGARHRHQVFHGRMRADFAEPYVFLY